MRFQELIAEVFRSIRSSKVSCTLAALVACVMILANILTVGRQAGLVANIEAQLQDAGSRQLVIMDNDGSGFITADTAAVIASFDTIDTVSGLAAPVDAVNAGIGPQGNRVPLWLLASDLDAVLRISAGRAPQPGEAVVSRTAMSKLGLATASGSLETVEEQIRYPVVGTFDPLPGFRDLGAGIVVWEPTLATFRELRMAIASIDVAQASSAAVLSVLAPPNPESLRVTSPSGLAETAMSLRNQLQTTGARNSLLILVVGALILAAVEFVDVLTHKQDIGRRRALGITRSDVIALVGLRALICVFAGMLFGIAAGVGVNISSGFNVSFVFTAANAALTVVVAALASLPPAAYATRVDPVLVLRVQ
jgi:putative ABC transport system permease protein